MLFHCGCRYIFDDNGCFWRDFFSRFHHSAPCVAYTIWGVLFLWQRMAEEDVAWPIVMARAPFEARFYDFDVVDDEGIASF